MNSIRNIIKKFCIILANNEKYISILRKDGVNIGKECVIDKTAIFGS